MKSCCFFSCILYSPSQSIPCGQPQRGFSLLLQRLHAPPGFNHCLSVPLTSVLLLYISLQVHMQPSGGLFPRYAAVISNTTCLNSCTTAIPVTSIPLSQGSSPAILALLFIHLLFNCRCLCYSASRYMLPSLTPKQFQELLEPFYILVWYIYIFSFSKCFYKAKLLEIRDLILHLIFKHRPKVKRSS